MELDNIRAIRKLTDAERLDCIARGACFRCRKTGHLSDDCPVFPSRTRRRVNAMETQTEEEEDHCRPTLLYPPVHPPPPCPPNAVPHFIER